MEIEEENSDNLKIAGGGKTQGEGEKDLEEKSDRKADFMLAEDEKR